MAEHPHNRELGVQFQTVRVTLRRKSRQDWRFATTARKSVTIVHHSERGFRVVEELPKSLRPIIPGEFTL